MESCIQVLIIFAFIFILLQPTNKKEQFCPKCGHSALCNICKKTLSKLNRKTLYETLEYVDELFTKNGIKYWLMTGTLLGAVREKDIIKWDYDIDIGCHIQDLYRILYLNNVCDPKIRFHFTQDREVHHLWNKRKIRRNMWGVSIIILYNNRPVGDIFLYETVNYFSEKDCLK